jgi:hypothetical protein
MSKHTPGPWFVGLQHVLEDGLPCIREASPETEWVVDAGTDLDGRRVCRLGAHNDRFTDELNQDTHERDINEANACLIAACPTMYDYIQSRAEEGDADAAQIIASIPRRKGT